MLKWIAGLVGAIVAVGALLWVVGSRLPVRHVATVERLLDSPVDSVWNVLTSPEEFPLWRRGVRSVERLPDRDERIAWIEHSRDGDLTFETVEASPSTHLVTRIANDDLPFGGKWTWQLEPREGGTRVVVTEDGEVYNPLFRVMSRYVFGHDTTMRNFLDDLERRLSTGPAGAGRSSAAEGS